MPRKTSAQNLKTPTGETYDVEAMRAKSVAQAQSYIDLIDKTQHVGSYFNVPPNMARWHFIRCGRVESPEAMGLAYRLRQKGYVKAPPQVRCFGFEMDGNNGLIVCCPPETREVLVREQMRAKKLISDNLEKSLGQQMVQDLSGLGQVSVTGTEGAFQGKLTS